MDILESLAATPPPPCIGCQHVQRCATRQHACMSFYMYAQDGWFPKNLRKMPNSKWFLAIDDAMDRRVLKLLRRRHKKMEANRERVNRQSAIYGYVSLYPAGIQAAAVIDAMTAIGIERGYVYKCLNNLRDLGRVKSLRPTDSRCAGAAETLWMPA